MIKKTWGLIAVLLCLMTIPTSYAQTKVTGDSIVKIARKQLGHPYKYGSSSPSQHFDCSGFTYYVYNSVGIDAPRVSRAYASIGKKVSIANAQPGDCMVFAGTQPNSTTPGHVGIVVSNDENGLLFIHSSSSKKHFGVVLTNYQSSGYPKRFLSVRRLI